jgi:hypothetical protein
MEPPECARPRRALSPALPIAFHRNATQLPGLRRKPRAEADSQLAAKGANAEVEVARTTARSRRAVPQTAPIPCDLALLFRGCSTSPRIRQKINATVIGGRGTPWRRINSSHLSRESHPYLFMDQKIPFCSPRTDRSEGAVPLQNEHLFVRSSSRKCWIRCLSGACVQRCPGGPVAFLPAAGIIGSRTAGSRTPCGRRCRGRAAPGP